MCGLVTWSPRFDLCKIQRFESFCRWIENTFLETDTYLSGFWHSQYLWMCNMGLGLHVFGPLDPFFKNYFWTPLAIWFKKVIFSWLYSYNNILLPKNIFIEDQFICFRSEIEAFGWTDQIPFRISFFLFYLCHYFFYKDI